MLNMPVQSTMAGKKKRRIRRLEQQVAEMRQAQQIQQANLLAVADQGIPGWALAGGAVAAGLLIYKLAKG